MNLLKMHLPPLRARVFFLHFYNLLREKLQLLCASPHSEDKSHSWPQECERLSAELRFIVTTIHNIFLINNYRKYDNLIYPYCLQALQVWTCRGTFRLMGSISSCFGSHYGRHSRITFVRVSTDSNPPWQRSAFHSTRTSTADAALFQTGLNPLGTRVNILHFQCKSYMVFK